MDTKQQILLILERHNLMEISASKASVAGFDVRKYETILRKS